MRFAVLVFWMLFASLAAAQDEADQSFELTCKIETRCEPGEPCTDFVDQVSLVQFPQEGLTVLKLPENGFARGIFTTMQGPNGRGIIASGTNQYGYVARVTIFGGGKVSVFLTGEGDAPDVLYFGTCLDAVG